MYHKYYHFYSNVIRSTLTIGIVLAGLQKRDARRQQTIDISCMKMKPLHGGGDDGTVAADDALFWPGQVERVSSSRTWGGLSGRLHWEYQDQFYQNVVKRFNNSCIRF